jgi:hypothetical protein
MRGLDAWLTSELRDDERPVCENCQEGEHDDCLGRTVLVLWRPTRLVAGGVRGLVFLDLFGQDRRSRRACAASTPDENVSARLDISHAG